MQTPSPRVPNTIIRSESSAAVGVTSTSMSSISQSSSQGNSMFRPYQSITGPPIAKFSTSTSTQSSLNGIAESRAPKIRPTPLRVSAMMNPDEVSVSNSQVSVDMSMNEVCIFDNIRMIYKILLCIVYY